MTDETKQTLEIEGAAEALRTQIHCKGDVTVEGWEQPRVAVEAQGGNATLIHTDGKAVIESDTACRVYLPQASGHTEIICYGQAKVSNLRGGLRLSQIKGDLLLEDVASVEIGVVSGRTQLTNASGDVSVQERAKGDLSAQGVQGDLSLAAVSGRLSLADVSSVQVGRAGGDLSVHNASGSVSVGRVGGKAELENIDGSVSLEKAGGDAAIRAVQGSVACSRVSGRLQLADVENVALRKVQGDLHAENVRGNFAAKKVLGQANLNRLSGSVSLAGVAGDLDVSDCDGMLSANCGGRARLDRVAGNVRLNAGGDIHCTLAEGTGATVKAVCGGGLTVDGGAETIGRSPGVHQFTVGDGGHNYALVAGGQIRIETSETISNSRSVGEAEAQEFAQFGEELGALGAELGAMGAEIAAGVGRRVSRDIQRKLKRGLRAKMRQMGARAAAGDWSDARSWDVRFRQAMDPASNPFADVDVELDDEPDGEPVSDEERMTVLRMLEEGKITAAEAERLLEALGSKI